MYNGELKKEYYTLSVNIIVFYFFNVYHHHFSVGELHGDISSEESTELLCVRLSSTSRPQHQQHNPCSCSTKSISILS